MHWRRLPGILGHQTPRRYLFNNYTKETYDYPTKEECIEFIFNSIKVITFSSVVWGFESHRKFQLHHLEVNDRIFSNYVHCLQRQNTKERCQREKQFLDYIFKQDY
tara:strand:+ start:12166 stop:12483 length:318 start_codon:yes stop_codon:yes gene_type:complete